MKHESIPPVMWLVAGILILLLLLVPMCVPWVFDETTPTPEPTPTPPSVVAIPTTEPTLVTVTVGPATPHMTATPRLPATPTAYVVVPTPIPPLPTPDVLPVLVPTMRPMPTGGQAPRQIPRR